MTYIEPELIVDETATAEAFLVAFADRIGFALGLDEDEMWESAEGSPETSVGEVVGILLSAAMALIADKERTDYAGFGELILNTPRLRAEPAEGTARWAFTGAGPYEVPDGAELVLDAADGTPWAFAVTGDYPVVGGYVDVPIAALEPGAGANGLIGAARDYTALPGLDSVTLLNPTVDGSEDETRDEYINRLARRARRMKLVPIVTDDYADTALDHPAVEGAVAVRLLNLDAPTDPPAAGGHVTVFVRGPLGANVATDDKEEVRLSMQGEDRPLAVTVHIGDPTRTDIVIAVSVRLAADADEEATVAAVTAALTAAYDDATYGLDEDAPGRWRAPRTTAERTINRFDVTSVIDDIPGLSKIEAATINGVDSVTMNGWAPLPNLAPVAAALTTALAGANNDLKFTADTGGAGGNSVRVRYVVAGNGTVLSVAVAGNDITVNVATNGGGAATSTAAQVRDAVNAHGAAGALVTAANATGNDGSGVVAALAYTNLSGGVDAVTVTVL